MSWLLGLFVYGGVIIKMAFDYFDKLLPINRKVVGSWILGTIVASLFYVAIGVTDYMSNAHTNKSLFVYLLCASFLGYLAPHAFLKGAGWFDKKTSQVLNNNLNTPPDATTKN